MQKKIDLRNLIIILYIKLNVNSNQFLNASNTNLIREYILFEFGKQF